MPAAPLPDPRRLPAAELFRRDAAEGAIRRPDNERVAVISAPLLRGLHFTLVEVLGDAAQDALYRTGYEWALQDMLRLNQQMQEQYGDKFDFWQADTKFVLDTWWAPLEAAGWGRLAWDLGAHARGIAFVDLHSSPVGAALAGTDQPICHLHAGLLAGAMSFFDRAERHAAEVQCRGVNAPFCQFVVGPGADVDAAEAWRQHGTPAAEILRRLR